MEIKLRKRDWQLLYELEKNARQSVQSLARKIGISKQLIGYHLKKHEQRKIILAYTALIDTSRLGYYTYRIYFKLRKLNTLEEKEKFIHFLVGLPETVIVNGIEGNWDVGTVVAVTHVYDFYAVWNKIMFYRAFIDFFKIGIYSPISHFTRTLLSPEPSKELAKVMTLGGSSRVDYDHEDLRLIKELAKNVRTPLVALAQKINRSPQFVARRIKYLEKVGIIQGYRPLFNWDLLGYHYFKIDVHLESYAKEKQMFEFCRRHPFIIQVNKVIGGSDFEFEVFAKSQKHLQSILQEFQSTFADVILNYDYFTVKKPYKETFMAL